LYSRNNFDMISTMIINQQNIIVGDCLLELPKISTVSVDAVVTSPPYNIGIPYRLYDDQKPRDAYMFWMKQVGIEITRVLKPDGSYFLNIGSTNVDPWFEMDVAMTLRDLFVLQNHIIWVKSISIHDDTIGHFKPINSKRFLNKNHESIFHFTLKGDVPLDRLSIGVPYKDKTNITRRGHAQDKRCAGNIWYIPYETAQSKVDKFNHPAGFPVGLPEKCLRLHGKPEGIVLDPFMGTGSTLCAAQKLGWSGIGIDVDQQYADMAVRRLTTSTATSQAT
jgi:site-specific DNA-methyltransferase (adenine-specific)